MAGAWSEVPEGAGEAHAGAPPNDLHGEGGGRRQQCQDRGQGQRHRHVDAAVGQRARRGGRRRVRGTKAPQGEEGRIKQKLHDYSK